MHTIDRSTLISQAQYAKFLRPYLPSEAFQPSKNKLLIQAINITILGLGWGIARHLHQWNSQYLWAFLPLALVMGNSVIVLLFSTHDVMHSKTVQKPWLRQLVSLIGMTMLWMPPALWKIIHHRVHHNNTNNLVDPDRNYLHSHPNNLGKWIQNLFAPSVDANPFWVCFGMGYSWGVYAFRNMMSVLLFDGKNDPFSVASVNGTAKERKAILIELGLIGTVHGSIIAVLGLHPVN